MKNKRKHGDGMLRLRSDGRWEGRVIIGYDEKGKAKTKNVLGKTKFECEEKLRKLKEALGKLVERITPDMPFGEWIDFWYQNFCKPALRPTTRMGYENCIYNHIIPCIGKIPLHKLSQNDLQQFYVQLKRNGRLQYVEACGAGMSDRTVRACHSLCKSALDKAIKENLISRNPSLGCKLPPKKSREMEILPPNEIWRFLAQAKEEGYYEIFLLELSTGMRRGELLGLKWNDLNLADGSLRIARQVVETSDGIIIQTPKTKSSVRTILLPPYMVEILAELKKTTKSEWIFPSPIKDNQPRYPSAVYHRFQLILKRAGCKQVRFHDLRHTFATMAIESGMDIKTLSNMIGHISAETTLNIYSHVTDTMRTQAAVKIEREIGDENALLTQTKNESTESDTRDFERNIKPYQPKFRKSGTGCIYQVSENVWEGSYSPKLPNGKRKKFNVYAKTKEECEKKLAELITEKKAEIAKLKQTQ